MPSSYPSRANKPGHYSAYPRERPSQRRIWRYTGAAGCLLMIFLFITSSPVPSAKDAAQHINPFGPTAHEPPIQRNSTSGGEARWFNHWRWLNPFSDAITDDESRSVLPPPKDRPPIYAFYDTDAEKNEEVKIAENKLLLTWRRAWWAQGFRPVILGKAEAMNNPLYERFQVRKTEHALGAEFMRWLAWGQMGTGVLTNWLALPMGSYDDPLLSYLRRGEYPKLTRYEDFGGGLFSGDKASIDAALNEAIDSPKLQTSKSILELLSSKTFSVDPTPNSIAFYDSSTLADRYKSISASLTDSKASGLASLSQLINSHLQLTFQNTFSAGIAILTPHRSHSMILSYPALIFANALVACPASPLPNSCPPNAPECIPCSDTKTLPLTTPESYTNTSDLFTIGTLPHPYTLSSLLARTKAITVRHIRRYSARDPWLQSSTQSTLGKHIGGPDRLVSFKDTVAGEWGAARGLWLIAEEDAALEKRELEWHFGFELASYNATAAFSSRDLKTAAITRELASLKLDEGSTEQKDSLGEKEVAHQRELVMHAREVLEMARKGKKRGRELLGIREAVEAWHLADSEAWRFARAFGARGRMERGKWEDEERKFAGGAEGRGDGWGRWFD